MKLVIGCGYLGHRVAQSWLGEGDQVTALTRSPDRAELLAAQQITPVVGDVTRPESLDLPEADTVLIAVGYDRRTPSASLFETYVGGLKHVLEALRSAHRIVYISSTGVFGQTDDEWVDEASVCQPTREGGQACLEAERLLNESPWGKRSVILRLAGIYGPNRIPSREQAVSRLDLSATGYLNLIHVEDAVQAVLASERYEAAPSMFLVSDGNPVARADYYRELVRHFEPTSGQTSSTVAKPDSPESAAQRRRSSKRVSNRCMIERLGVKLRFPSYREGLAAIAAGC